MKLHKGIFAAAMVTGLFSASAAQAATYILNVTGSVGLTQTGSFVIGGTTYDTGSLDLGFDPNVSAPITLQTGDEVQFHVSLDAPFTVPASDNQFFGLNIRNTASNVDPVSATTTGTFLFDNSIVPVGNGCGNCLSALTYNAPGAAFSFQTLSADEFYTLGQPFDINDVSISYQLNNNVSAVPETSTWIMMLLGFFGLGFMVRIAHRKHTISVA